MRPSNPIGGWYARPFEGRPDRGRRQRRRLQNSHRATGAARENAKQRPADRPAAGGPWGGTLPVAEAAATLTVVRPDLGAVRGVAVGGLVELRRVVDLILRTVDVHALPVGVHPVDHAGREKDLLAE